MNPVKKDAAQLEHERDYWFREAIATQEMLAQVLVVAGGRVEVKAGTPLPEDVGIFIDLDEERGVFVFEIAKKDEEGNRVDTE